MICPECESEFEPIRPNQKYCSPEHSKRAERRRAKQRYRKRKADTGKLLTTIPPGRTGGPQSAYTDEEREFYLRAIALAGGNCAAAQRGLEELGFPIKVTALYDFKRDQADRYALIREQVAPELKARRAEAHEGLADKLADVSDTIVDELRGALERGELKPHQLPGTLRDVTVASGIHRDKAAKLRGEDIKVVHYKTPDEIIRQLKRIAPDMVIEGDAEEIPTGQD